MTEVANARPKLKHVRFTRAKGYLYAYFDTGRRNRKGRPIYTPLPKFGTDAFYECYAQLAGAREVVDKELFDQKRFERDVKATRKAAEASLKRERRQVVYFIQAPEGQIKIGVTCDLKERFRTLQVGHHGKLKRLAVIKGGVEVEKAYHERFAAHRLHGEWFWPHPEILAEAKRIRREEQNAGTQTRTQTGLGGRENRDCNLYPT